MAGFDCGRPETRYGRQPKNANTAILCYAKMELMCVHIENPLFSELRIPYCVRAGETDTFQLRYPPEKSRFQTGLTLAT